MTSRTIYGRSLWFHCDVSNSIRRGVNETVTQGTEVEQYKRILNSLTAQSRRIDCSSLFCTLSKSK